MLRERLGLHNITCTETLVVAYFHCKAAAVPTKQARMAHAREFRHPHGVASVTDASGRQTMAPTIVLPNIKAVEMADPTPPAAGTRKR